MKVDFKFNIGDEAEIDDCASRVAKVKGLFVDEDGVNHVFAQWYSDDGAQNRVYIRESDLSHVDKAQWCGVEVVRESSDA